jgi:hypothetical protein
MKQSLHFFFILKHTQQIYQRINEMDEQLKLEAMAAAASMSSSVQEDQQSAVGAGGSTSGHHRSPVKSPSNNDSLVKVRCIFISFSLSLT